MQWDEIIESWIEDRKTGSITLNFYMGGISNLVTKESHKVDTTEKKEIHCGREKNVKKVTG